MDNDRLDEIAGKMSTGGEYAGEGKEVCFQMCIFVRLCGCVCVCVWRERERERGRRRCWEEPGGFVSPLSIIISNCPRASTLTV